MRLVDDNYFLRYTQCSVLGKKEYIQHWFSPSSMSWSDMASCRCDSKIVWYYCMSCKNWNISMNVRGRLTCNHSLVIFLYACAIHHEDVALHWSIVRQGRKFSLPLTCLRTKLNRWPLSSLCGSCLALIRKCIKAGEPRDKPATTGPNPISLSL